MHFVVLEDSGQQPMVLLPLEYVVAPLHRKLSVLFVLMSLSDALGQHSGIQTKDFLSARDLPRTKFNPDPFGKCRNRNPRSLNHPAQIISAHQHLNIKHVLVV